MLLLCSCLFGLFISNSGASVSLTIKADVSSIQDGSKVILICTISPYMNAMTWLVNNDPYADCFLSSCGTSPNKPYKFIFNFDESNGEFNLTIQSVNTSHTGLLFACDDGIERKTITFNVTTGDQNNSSIMNTTSTTVNKPSESDEPSGNTLNIVVGCIFGSIVGVIVLSVLVIIILHCYVSTKIQPKFTKIELEDTEIYLEWTDSLNFCSKIFRYNIVCSPTQGQVKDKNCREEFTKKKKFALENLDPMAIYQISLSRKLCCFKSSATQISVITRKAGMLNDQGYTSNLTIIEVRWTKPDCISNPQLQYEITCNKVKKDRTDKTMYTIKDLIAYETYKIEVVAINNGKNSLLFTEEISATPIKLCLEDVCYGPENTNVKCNIRWIVSHKPEPLNKSDKFHFNVICRSKEEQVHKEKKITDSSYTIPHLYPDRSYTVYVYAIYNSIQLEPPCKIKLAPYIPTWDSEPTSKSTEIELKWKRPEYTGVKPLTYEVTYNKGNKKIVYKTSEISYTITNLEPSQTYDVWIFTIINEGNGMKSLPLQRKIRTQPSFPPIGNVQHGGNHHLPNNAEDAV